MPIGAGIFNALGTKPKSMLDYTGELQQQDQGAIGIQNALQSQRDAAAMRSTVGGLTGDPKSDYSALLRVNPDAAAKYLKSQNDSLETQSKVGLQDSQKKASDLKSQIDKHDFAVQQLTTVKTPQDALTWLTKQRADGVFNDQDVMQHASAILQASTNPQAFEQWRQGTIESGASATEQLKLKQAAKLAADANQTHRDINANTQAAEDRRAAASRGVTMRGQDMADARTREGTVATMTKPFEVTGPDGQPMLVQQDKQGNIAPVQGYGPKTGSTKPLTDAQAKALGFGTRMQEADKALTSLAAGGTNTPSLIKQGAESIPGIGGALGMAANSIVASPQQQQVEQAQRDFVNAILRRESGAAISESEFQNARKQYFNQPGDSSEVKTQKAANRKLAAEGVMAEVPKGQRGSIGPQAASAGAYSDAEKERRYQEWKRKQQ